MDLSSIDHTSDSDSDVDSENDEQIPMAVPVSAIVTTKSADEIDSDDEEDDAEGAGDRNHAAADTTFDTADVMDDDTGSIATEMTPPPTSSTKKRSNSEISDPTAQTDSGKKRKYNDGKPRQPAAKGLTIPFRTIKRIMKIDSAIGIVQNDAAIVATAALEQFVKQFAVKSLELAKKKGRNTIKYDDVAEVRASDPSLSFLDLLMP